MATIFTVKKNALRDISAEEATRLFRNLLWCEARRIGLSPHNVVISLDITIPDGGIDARVDAQINTNSILAKGSTHFQLKVGHGFKPWQLSALKKELFGKSNAKPKKEILAPGIRECLKNRGRYVLITFGHDLTPVQHSSVKKQLTKLLRTCGYRAPNVDVLGQGQIIGQLSQFPSLSLAIQDKGDLSFLTVEEWKTLADMVQPLRISEEQNQVIETIRDELHGTKYKHIRLIGEPGLGKTRVALEALTAEDLAPLVLYAPHAEDFQRSQLFNELLRREAGESVVLVIDECSEKERASIWNAFRERKNIQLLTIDHGPEQSRDGAMMVLDLPRLRDEQIKAILSSYVPNVDPSHWVAWCEGSPRVAHAVGENLQSNPEDLLKPPATVPLWDRFIAGYESLDNQISQETLTILRHLALFTKFGFEDPVAQEAKFIWQLVQRANPAITWQRFQELVNRLRQRRILQGKRTLFIVPKALHIHLWINYWNNYGRDFSFVDFFAEVPSQLQNWFLESFIYGHASPVASDVIARILSPSGPFSDRAFLTGQAGTRFIRYLSDADPGKTLSFVERTFGSWAKEDLLRFDDGRQDIVWALEKIAVWKDYFPRAARVLVKLALAENSKYGNNSTGILRSLFRTHPAGLAATQSAPVDRFPIITELLQSQNEDEIALALSLCKEWLSTQGGFRTVGAEYQGLRTVLEFWKPKIWGELFDAWRLCWRHLWSVSRDWPPQQRQRANRVLVDSGLELVNVKPLSAEIMTTLSEIVDDEATDRREFTHRLIGKLRFRSERLPRELVNRLRGLDKKLTGKSFWERFCRFVLNTNWDEDYTFKGDKSKESPIPTRRVKKLVGEFIAQKHVIRDHLPKICSAEGHRLFDFGRLLAAELDEDSVVNEIIEAQLNADPTKNTQFIGGYFSGFRAQNSDRWERLVQGLLGSERTRTLGITIVLYSGRSESILRTLVKMFQSKTVDASVFNGLGLEAPKTGFSPEVVEEVFEALVSNNDEQSLRVAIELADYYFFDKENPRGCGEQILFQLITAPYFFQRDNNDHYHYAWQRVAQGFRARFQQRDMEILKVILSSGNDLGIRHSNYPAQLADTIARDHPDDAWAIISGNLESDQERSVWLEMWLGEEFSFDDDKVVGPITVFDPDSVMEWIMKDPDKGARRILRCLPKTLDEKQGGKLTKLFIEAFGDSEFGESLESHFWTGGWSGKQSVYLAGKRDKAWQWILEIKSGKILAWLYRYIEHLNDLIARAEIREERGFE